MRASQWNPSIKWSQAFCLKCFHIGIIVFDGIYIFLYIHQYQLVHKTAFSAHVWLIRWDRWDYWSNYSRTKYMWLPYKRAQTSFWVVLWIIMLSFKTSLYYNENSTLSSEQVMACPQASSTCLFFSLDVYERLKHYIKARYLYINIHWKF